MVITGLVLPTSPIVAVAWLLPAAGFIAVVLTASNWVDPTHAAAAVGVAWVALVSWAVRTDDPLAVFAPVAMGAYVVLLVVAILALLYRLFGSTPSWRLH